MGRVGALLVAAVAGCASRSHVTATWPLPALVVWAWDRPEDLRFLPAGVGVAYLDATAYLVGGRVDWRPRVSSLRLGEGVHAVPVVRIETTPTTPTLDDAQRAELVRRLCGIATEQGALQIDYEAPLSQRGFYRRLLGDLRQRLGPEFPLSMTALASWCLGDRWMADLPVDEIVPMATASGKTGRGCAPTSPAGSTWRPSAGGRMASSPTSR